ncbi:MAG: PIN domain-containing protein [Terracidiphilus sp.]
MRCLLDVNVLIALGYIQHEFHDRVAGWVRSKKVHPLLTCSLTELGFVRILAQTVAYGFTVHRARELLLELKTSTEFQFEFVPDQNDISLLPDWVKTGKSVSDGHLLNLASRHRAALATLDARIPGAFLIPFP